MSSAGLHIVCLCAAWCRACEAYAPLFAATAPQGRWIDIEDEAELVGELEVDSFPTLLIYDAKAIHFAGPVRPDAATLQRLIASAQGSGLPAVPAAVAALVRSLRDGR